jgi:hypothetical protein
LITANGSDGRVIRWNLVLGEVVETARTAAGRDLSDAERREYAIDVMLPSTPRVGTFRTLFKEPFDDWETALDSQVELECDGAPLADIVDRLSETYALAAVLDHDALAAVNVVFDAPIKVTQKNTTLRIALNEALGPLGLGFEIRGHVLAITKASRER